ncbi:hypothetical protein FOB90_00965 [Mammaliicoccus fleurettii]|uniref:Uncharacterized protein n=1 Tax=Staphylococcus schleiferi TaxID=1295 RepID=A0ABX0FYQ3_STASC|nr:hypothetical protein [Staphylococcus schleiferi]NHA34007.1 hypothetical protein [Staphylococcus schleiferi]QGS45354.1 hypothetical protein FOB90_00965 [Mammaliicoccus fleurettii]
MTKSASNISTLTTILSLIILVITFAFVNADFLWYIPGAIIISINTVLNLFFFISARSRIAFVYIIVNLLALLLFSSPLLLA